MSDKKGDLTRSMVIKRNKKTITPGKIRNNNYLQLW